MLSLNRNRISRILAGKKNRKGLSARTLRCEPLEDRRVLAVVTTGADSGAGSLRAAIDNAAVNEIITFAPAVTAVNLTTGALLIDVDGVVVDGALPAGGKVTVSSNGTDRVFTVDDGDYYVNTMTATLKNLTITGGGGTSYGGGIFNAEDLTIDNAMITGNTALDPGGVYTAVGGGIDSSGNLTISNSMVTGNRAGGTLIAGYLAGLGGGINMNAYGALTMTGTSVDNNSAMEYGGGVRIAGVGPHSITGGTISGNKLGNTGAGIAQGFNAMGGGLWADAGAGTYGMSLTIDGTTVSNNEAGGTEIATDGIFDYGGGLDITTEDASDVVTLKNLTVSGNTLTSANAGGDPVGRGGGVSLSAVNGGTFNVEGGTISNNSMGAGQFNYGGGISFGSFTSVGGTFNVTDTVISGNTGSRGGGLGTRYNGGANNEAPSTVNLKGVTVENNYALYVAGAMWAWKSTDITLDSSPATGNGTVVRNNTSPDSGGFLATSNRFVDPTIVPPRFGPVSLTINNSTLSGNNSLGDVGGAVNTGSYFLGEVGATIGTTSLSNSTISGNSAVDGGGIRSYDANLYLSQVTGYGNYAYGNGGFLNLRTFYGYVGTPDQAQFTLYSSTVAGNTALGVGGGAYLDQYARIDIRNSIISDNRYSTTADDDLYSQNATATEINIGDSLIKVNGAANYTDTSNGANIFGVSANLGVLQNNGGPTDTMLPNAGSPAIDAGDPSAAGVADQRGFTPRVVNGQIDMGSVEVGATGSLPCDLDGDGDCDIDDLDLLCADVFAGNRPLSDVDQWLADASPFANPYLKGDADLNGIVDGNDFITWNTFKFTASGGLWSRGDFNCDGLTDGQDFIIWNGNKFQNSFLIDGGTNGDATTDLAGAGRSAASRNAAPGKTMHDATAELAVDHAMRTGQRQMQRRVTAPAPVVFAAPAAISVTAQAEVVKTVASEEARPVVLNSTNLEGFKAKNFELRRTTDKVQTASAVDAIFANLG